MKNKIEKSALIATVGISILISLLDLSGLLGSITWFSDRIPTITLLVLGIIAFYLVSERTTKLDHIEELIVEGTERTLSSLSGVEAHILNTSEEAFEYMAKSIKEAKMKIDHAALAPPIPRRTSSQEWEKAISKVLSENKVIYRYVASFKDKTRWERVKQHLMNSEIQKYYVGYFDIPNDSPLSLSFILIDEKKIIMHYPYEPGQAEVFLAIEHKEIANVFSAYFNSLWQNAKKINIGGINQQTIAELESKLK